MCNSESSIYTDSHQCIGDFNLLQITPSLVLGVPNRFLTRVQEQGPSQKFHGWWLSPFWLGPMKVTAPWATVVRTNPNISVASLELCSFLRLYQPQQFLLGPISSPQAVKDICWSVAE